MTDPQDEKLIKLYQHSRQEEPSVSIDQSIHQAAEKALYRKRKHWLWGLSTAAILVISFNVVLELMLDTPEELEEVILSQHDQSTRSPAEMPSAINETRFSSSVAQDAADEAAVGRSAGISVDKELETAESALSADPQKIKAEGPRNDYDEVLKERQFAVPEQSKEALTRAESFHPKAMAEKKKRALPVVPVIPELPSTMNSLLAMNHQITGEQAVSGLMTFYYRDKLILTIKPTSELVQYKAWPGSEVLGIKMDWSIKPVQTRGCIKGPVYQSCNLTDQVKGLYEDDRLDHILWNRHND